MTTEAWTPIECRHPGGTGSRGDTGPGTSDTAALRGQARNPSRASPRLRVMEVPGTKHKIGRKRGANRGQEVTTNIHHEPGRPGKQRQDRETQDAGVPGRGHRRDTNTLNTAEGPALQTGKFGRSTGRAACPRRKSETRRKWETRECPGVYLAH